MDLLYSRYASPFEFMRPYIETGRFGEWVTDVIRTENERRRAQAEKEDEEKLWTAYVHSYSDKPFSEWKTSVLKPAKTGSGKRDDDMTNEDIEALLHRLFPQQE